MKYKVDLTTEQVKLLAILAMTLDHIALVLPVPAGLWYDVFEIIGNFTAVTMCFLLTEGFFHTKSRGRYALRLLIFALLSQPAFWWAFHVPALNMLFTLLICLGILCLLDGIADARVSGVLCAGLVVLSGVCDWPFLIAAQTVLFYRSRGNGSRQRRAFMVFAAMLFAATLGNDLQARGMAWPQAICHAAFSCVPVFASMVVLLCGHHGRRATRGRAWWKWLFYLYYPVHLYVLCQVRQCFM